MKANILVVDDQVSSLDHIKAIFENEDYEVMAFCDPYRALEGLGSNFFDILIVNMKLPGIEGLELFRIARRMYPKITGIIMSAHGDVPSAVEAIKEGVSDYMQKPFEPEIPYGRQPISAVEISIEGRLVIFRQLSSLESHIEHARPCFSNELLPHVPMKAYVGQTLSQNGKIGVLHFRQHP